MRPCPLPTGWPRVWLPVLLAVPLLFTQASGEPKKWDRSGAIKYYQQARNLHASLEATTEAKRTPQDYVEVILKYRQVPLKDPHYGGCDDAIFFMARLYHAMGDQFQETRYYRWASETYLRVVSEYPSTPYAPAALVGAGQILIEKLDEASKGEAYLTRVASKHSRSRHAKSARELLNPPAAAAEASSGSPLREVASVSAPVEKKTTPSPSPGTLLAAPLSTDLPRPAKPTGSGVRNLTRTLGLKLGKIVLDPGHGGHDRGTIAKNGLKEKDLALDLALRLRTLIQERLGGEVILTRESDVFIPLEERTQLANRHKADLFVSIHANYSRNSRVSGVETYVLNFARTAEERELAARENAASQRTISELEDLVRSITRREKLEESRELARHVQKRLQLEMARQNPKTVNRGIKQAPFVVLAGATMPSVLTEVAFLSNPRDAAALAADKGREAAAEALFRGISDYIASLGAQAGSAAGTSH